MLNYKVGSVLGAFEKKFIGFIVGSFNFLNFTVSGLHLLVYVQSLKEYISLSGLLIVHLFPNEAPKD